MIPVNSLSRHIAPLQDDLARIAGDIIGSGYYVLGPHVTRFEDSFAKYCGVSHCIGVANGTDALEIGLKAIGVGAGDQVAACANAAMYGTTAILACGAAPVYIDILQNGTMDPEALARSLQSGGIKAVIVTHLFGQLAEMPPILEICARSGVLILEDCAQAHGARDIEGHLAGSFGDVASFSFYPTKNLGALGDGGAIATNDDSIAAKARQLRQYGWTQKYTNGVGGGRNSRLDEIQAAMLLRMLPDLDGWNDRRRAIANRYSSEIRNTAIRTPPVGRSDYVAHLYVIRSEQRERLRSHLTESGIQTEIHYPLPDHQQPCHGDRYLRSHLPATERDAMQVLTLPCFPEMEDSEVAAVIEACNRF